MCSIRKNTECLQRYATAIVQTHRRLRDAAVVFNKLIWNQIEDWYIEYFPWNCSRLNAKTHRWWLINIGSGNGVVTSGNTPSSEPMWPQIYVAIWSKNRKNVFKWNMNEEREKVTGNQSNYAENLKMRQYRVSDCGGWSVWCNDIVRVQFHFTILFRKYTDTIFITMTF